MWNKIEINSIPLDTPVYFLVRSKKDNIYVLEEKLGIRLCIEQKISNYTMKQLKYLDGEVIAWCEHKV